ncbi:TRM11 family SAM-dependent methyltransferase [Radiobacillus sp. PE A8.2]|uniref:TRM11 family SAM-dependent methyltransferase n=1 Tax=Radiobacillus sp. PE A8.2 TaxID=3380349 RepID=UPI0038909F48
MNHTKQIEKFYIYNYACSEEEDQLCRLEMRALFGVNAVSKVMESSLCVDPSRSPFIRGRLDVIFQGNKIDEIFDQVKGLPDIAETFKVEFIKLSTNAEQEQIEYSERLKLVRAVGSIVKGKADLHNPEKIFGILFLEGRWIFGVYHENKAIWLQHKQKPHSYSTALNTRVARAIVNIAVPNPIGIKVIDPCCGIGTVLVEALSMGIKITGSDINPLVMKGARENIAHFGLSGEVALKDIREISSNYDVAIIDLPYNLCSVITIEEQLEMLECAREFARKVVLVTVEQIDSIIDKAGFQITDRCELKKRTFTRQVIVCE